MIAASSLAAAALAGTALGNPAGIGVGIQGNSVCLAVTAGPGHSYALGKVYVQDTGSGDERISVQAAPVWKGQGWYGHAIPLPPSWITVAYPPLLWVIPQHSVKLSAGQGAYLSVTLNVPADAKRGMYAGNLVAGTGTPAPAGGISATLGAAAATDVEFGVGVAPPSCSQQAAPSPSVIAASERARAAGQFSSAAPAAGARPKRQYAGFAILAALATLGLLLLRKVWRWLAR